MGDLRKKLIRLAYAKPHLRKDILPLVKQARFRSSGNDEMDQMAQYIISSLKRKGWSEPSVLADPGQILLEWGEDEGHANLHINVGKFRGKPVLVYQTEFSRPLRDVEKAIKQLQSDAENY